MRLNERKKIAKSFDELVTFLLIRKYNKIVSEIDFLDDKTIIILKIDNLSLEDSKTISAALKDKRNESIEEFGWELLGESEDSTELELVGALFDEFALEKNDDITTIKLTRFFQ